MREHKEVSYRRTCDDSPCELEHSYYCMAPSCGELFRTDKSTHAVEESGKVMASVHWPYHNLLCAEENGFLFWKERVLVHDNA